VIDHCDVLIVGGGGAALRAAIAAHQQDPALDIMLATKGTLGSSGVTSSACSDRMAFHATLPTTEPREEGSWRLHADDIYRIGGLVSDYDLAEILARGAAKAFQFLDDLGVPWVRKDDGSPDQFVTDGSLYPRACYTGPYTAVHISQALVKELKTRPVRIVERAMVVDLLVDRTENAVRGALLIHEGSAQVFQISAKAIVLATGGAGQVFAHNVFPPDCTGDGLALALRAGAELVNLEFVQIGLCSTATGLACSGSMMRALPRFTNDAGEDLLLKHLARQHSPQDALDILFSKGASWPVSYREPSHLIDVIASAEMADGRRVFLDYASNPYGLQSDSLPEAAADWYAGKGLSLGAPPVFDRPFTRLEAINRPSIQWFAERGISLATGDMLEIAPSAQHFQGGIKIRHRGDTTLARLYAAGEVAGGQHGANRPGGNALLDCQVFGRISGASAAAFARSVQRVDGNSPVMAAECLDRLFSADGLPPDQVRTEVQSLMSEHCSVIRTRAGLCLLSNRLSELRQQGIRENNPLCSRDIEAVNVLWSASAIVASALHRGESRGPHLLFSDARSRTPLPRNDERWSRYIVVSASDGQMHAEAREPVHPD